MIIPFNFISYFETLLLHGPVSSINGFNNFEGLSCIFNLDDLHWFVTIR